MVDPLNIFQQLTTTIHCPPFLNSEKKRKKKGKKKEKKKERNLKQLLLYLWFYTLDSYLRSVMLAAAKKSWILAGERVYPIESKPYHALPVLGKEATLGMEPWTCWNLAAVIGLRLPGCWFYQILSHDEVFLTPSFLPIVYASNYIITTTGVILYYHVLVIFSICHLMDHISRPSFSIDVLSQSVRTYSKYR